MSAMQCRRRLQAAISTLIVGAWLALPGIGAVRAALVETESLVAQVKAGRLAPIGKRLPAFPLVSVPDGPHSRLGRHGGTLRTLIGRARDVRLLFVYGYARLVVFNQKLEIVPDILERVEVRENREFILHLRKGHRWSDGHPFTAEDFRYYWEDVANNRELSPSGPPRDLIVYGERPQFSVIDATTVRYRWKEPNPEFLPRLAGASPLLIYRPAHYLKKFHVKYSKGLRAKVRADSRTRNWARGHNNKDNMYRFDNPDLPTLQPWVNTVRPPADRFVGVRNPYFHRIDAAGRQLPYIDRVELMVVADKLIAVKAGTGESDLQARGLDFKDYTFLKQNEKDNGYRTLLWRSGMGSQMALYPNLNVNDPVWRRLIRDVRFRRALSLAIDRSLINHVLYFGLAKESGNTMQVESPLFDAGNQSLWSGYDRKAAQELLDEIGLKRGLDGIRRLPDGRLLEIIVDSAGESTEDTDVLELIRETWREIGVKMFVKPSQREVFRNRIFSGNAMMSIWGGLENALATPDTSPEQLAPTTQQQLQWPKFGQFHESGGSSGVAPDIPEIQELAELLTVWRHSASTEKRAAAWQRMLRIHAEQQYVIGTVTRVPQPVVATSRLMNLPTTGLYNWEPGAFFGIHRPDLMWFQ